MFLRCCCVVTPTQGSDRLIAASRVLAMRLIFGILRSVKPKRRRPGLDFAVNPGPSVRCVREAAPRLFYARAARHCPVLQWGLHCGAREDVPGVPLRSLRGSRDDMQRLRSRPNLLPGTLRARATAGVSASGRRTLPAQSAGRAPSRGAPAEMASAARL
jgi:hypothetical protein